MILVECKPDKLLVVVLANISRREVRHAGNKFDLMKKLEKLDGALGIIDEDPGKNQPKQLSEAMDISTESVLKSDLKLMRYRGNLVLVIRPRLEEWILKTMEELGISPKEFSIPKDPELLHATINYNLNKLEKLLLKMREKRDKSKRLRSLVNIIKQKEKPNKKSRETTSECFHC